ncbi:unnamed protein product [Phyllotreta striolata]|uniref:DEUBAD domain-containing protein n=1 Tax=Phyllotreta striolata TaxID=444603 RepID=A0A9N9XP25_PHYSR|nr:unnamed protein product [Phyllotreta striolata]
MDNSTSEDSSSDYSTESSDDDGMEVAQIGNVRLQLPQGLCERQDIFREILSTETWNSLSEDNRQHLQTFLPNFPEDDELEKTKTLQRLFDFDVFKFTSPLVKFHDDLKAGYFRPDIARMRKIIRKAERNEAKYRYKLYRKQLKDEIVESQRELLAQARHLPPGVEPKRPKRHTKVDYVCSRTKRRYFQTLQAVKSKADDAGCSSDENYPEGPPGSLSRKQKRHLSGIRSSLSNADEPFYSSTMVGKAHAFPLDLEKYITPGHNPFYVNDDSYRGLMREHKRRKLERDEPELNTKGVTIADVVRRTRLPYSKTTKHRAESKSIGKKKAKRKQSEHVFNHKISRSSNSDSDSDALENPSRSKKPNRNVKIKKEPNATVPAPSPVYQPINSISQYGKITPACVEDLDGIDVMNIPIDLDNSDIDILELSNKPELMQDTHSNFFSLVRDVVCSTCDHRMSMYTLQERIKTWQENPISPLNDWYSFADNWIDVLPSAITFLCGNASDQPEDFVPYVEYKTNLDVYQWIGAGRDSDALLNGLCAFWLEHKTETKEAAAGREEIDVDITDRSSSPPPPRYPTTWTVRKATGDEIKEFREQERKRYDNPHKAFTYRHNGYESVVGPIKGIYNPAVGSSKARGHTMLSADRPNFVTILSLVRDAAARLPNGEGTRAEICELLKSSQYISSTAPDNVLQSVVSGALDRMHTQWDPCVKYDAKKKIWIYLHRNRSEEDFERIHQQYQGINKTKKTPAKKSTAKQPKQKQSPDKSKTGKTESPPPPPPPLHETGPVKAARRSSVAAAVQPPPPPSVKQPPPAQNPAVTVQSTQAAPLPGLVTVAAPPKGTSLLLSNNPPKQQQQETTAGVVVGAPVMSNEPPPLAAASSNAPSKQAKDAAAEVLMGKGLGMVQAGRVSSPTLKNAKGLVKILSPSQGKSLIIPTTNAQFLKHLQEQSGSPKQAVTQQLLQTLAQQKQILVQKHQQQQLEASEQQQEKPKAKTPAGNSVLQQQILQLQNIKNVTLLRTSPTAGGDSGADQQANIVTVAVSKQAEAGVQIKTQGNLTQAQQQQILQTIKQKILPNAGLLANPQQIVLKQKGGVINVQKSTVGGGSQVVGQQKINADVVKSVTSSQGPVVAKVLTNAAGQVISVESLLPQQKQASVLSQGATLRLATSKTGQQNLIHLSTAAKSAAIAQLTVGSPNNILTLTTQPKLVVPSQQPATAASVAGRSFGKAPGVAKINAKGGVVGGAQQFELLNAKVVQRVDQKLVIGQPKAGQTKLQLQLPAAQGGKTAANGSPQTAKGGGANAVRMANLNLSGLGCKPVLLASGKAGGGSIQNLQGQNVILQTQGGSSTASLVLQNANVKTAGSNNVAQPTGANSINIINQSNIVFSPQVKVQSGQQQVVFTTKGGQSQGQSISQGQIVIGGHPVRLHTSNATNTQRVVLASQGQGGQIVAQQILLPAGFQGTAINIKALQGVKVIPIAQAAGQQNKGIQSRHVLAHVVNSSAARTATNQSSPAAASGDKSVPSQEGE